MNFPVPWRALLPIDALEVITGKNGSVLKEICDASGAGVEVSGDGETPESLSDKIVTISGAVEQKEAACRRCVDKLRVLQEVADQEPGVFVIIVPSCAAPMVVGQRGAQIKEVIELSGAEISVGKENILGMVDQPIGITGTGGQVVSAVSKINAILQDLADRGKLQPSDFKYRPGAVPREMGMGGPRESGPRMPSNSNPRTHAKFLVATQVAGWIIGKQGRHIRELQENSGAHIQVLKEGDVPPGVSPTDRVVEIGGTFDSRAEGIQIVLMAVDSMPALQAPRETLMLISRNLTQDTEIRDVQQMSGAEIEVRDLPGYDEALCTLLGTIEARVKAAQQFLTRLEEMAGSGAPPAAPAPGTPERAVPTFGAPAPAPQREVFARPEERKPAAAPEPASNAGQQAPEPASNADPWSQQDPWSQGRQPPAARPAQAPPAASRSGPEHDDPWSQPAPRADREDHFSKPASKEQSIPQKTTSFKEPEIITYNPKDPAASPITPPASSFSPAVHSGPNASTASSNSTSPPSHNTQQGNAPASFSPDRAFSSSGSGNQSSMTSFNPTGPGVGGQMGGNHPNGSGSQASTTSFNPSGPGMGGQMGGNNPNGSGSPASATSFNPTGPGMGGPMDGNAMTGSGNQGSMTSFNPSGPGMGGPMGGMGGPMGGPMGMMNPMGMMGMSGMGGMGMGAMGPMALQQILQQSMLGQSQAQLALLLPVDLIQQALIPNGHLAEIAQTCSLNIDLGAEISGMRQVTLTGTVAANAMAAYFLQERSLQYAGGKMA